jgi:hypothetical protein
MRLVVQFRRPHRDQGPRGNRVLWSGIFCCLLLLSAACWVVLAGREGHLAWREGIESQLAVAQAAHGATGRVPQRNGRAVYPYSVVPGGVESPEEVRSAIRQDRVVAEHYQGFKADRVRVETVEGPRLVHVSYRVGDRVYWTRKKVLLNRGEMVLSDGASLIRARCGNRISETPGPVSAAAEPTEQTLNTPVAPAPLVLSPPSDHPVLGASPAELLAGQRPFESMVLSPASPVGRGMRIWPFLLPALSVPAFLIRPEEATLPASTQPTPAVEAPSSPAPPDPSGPPPTGPETPTPTNPSPEPPFSPLAPPPADPRSLPADPAPPAAPKPDPGELRTLPPPPPDFKPEDPSAPPAKPLGVTPPSYVPSATPGATLVPPPSPESTRPNEIGPPPSVVVTPEPSFYGLLGAGLAALFWFARRRKVE